MGEAVDGWLGGAAGGIRHAGGSDISGASSALVGALDLRASWEDSFADAEGREGFVERTGECWYVEDDIMKAVAMPMEDGLTFVCFAGSRAGRFDKLAGMKKETVHAVLPELALESAFDGTDLTGFLLSRGVDSALDPLSANFYNMCQGGDWFLQEVLLEAGIETSAREAGAAAEGRAAGASGAKEFVADGPCSFAVFSGFGTDRQYMLLYGQLEG